MAMLIMVLFTLKASGSMPVTENKSHVMVCAAECVESAIAIERMAVCSGVFMQLKIYSRFVMCL